VGVIVGVIVPGTVGVIVPGTVGVIRVCCNFEVFVFTEQKCTGPGADLRLDNDQWRT
jgi:hypothetical protein